MTSRWSGVPSLLGDLGLRLAALVLALGVVLLVGEGGRRELVVPVPVRLEGVADSLIPAAVPPAQVDVRFRGGPGALVRLRLNPPEIVLDLSDLAPGRIVLREIRPADVRLPSRTGAVVVAIVAPRFVSVGVDQPLVKYVPVEPSWTGVFPSGWTFGSEPLLVPRQVRIEGPAAIVGPIELLRTAPIDLAREGMSQAFSVPVAAPAPPVIVEPALLSVRLSLDTISEQTFRDIPVQVLTNRLVSRSVPSPSRVSLTLRGPRSLLALVRASSLSPRVDARNLLSGKHFLLVRVDDPGPGLRLSGIDPDHISVSLD